MKRPFIPDDAPFNDSQKSWLAGFMAGLHSRLLVLEEAKSKVDAEQATDTASANPSIKIHILYGSQTGNCEQIAQEASAAARVQGFIPIVQELDEIDLNALIAMRYILVISSTYGEGEMPDNAQLFWQNISASSAPRLENLRFSVLALGDSNYDEFCHAGKMLDMRLEQLGAKRLTKRIDCDVDYEAPAKQWVDDTLEQLSLIIKKTAPNSLQTSGEDLVASQIDSAVNPPRKAAIPGSSRKNPLPAALSVNRRLSGEKSGKDIRHLEFDIEGSGLTYEAGDALGVIPVNDPALVNLIIKQLNANFDSPVPGQNEQSLGDLLTYQLEISTPSKKLLDFIASIANNQELNHILIHGDKDAIAAWLWGKDVLDLLRLAPHATIGIPEFISLLRPLQHRAYSIASSSKQHPNSVHLSVAAVRYTSAQRVRGGVCSTYLADRVQRSNKPLIFLAPNKAFRVPKNSDAPMIMVGPGVGIAPFRAFIQERKASDAKGKNWLFFGDQHQEHDFLYENELTAWQKDGILSRLDVAFSRDQAQKVYVQHRMIEQGAELYAWLQEGGHFYICGDATNMAKDVDEALQSIIAKHGGYSPEKTAEYINQLKREKRYVRDVY